MEVVIIDSDRNERGHFIQPKGTATNLRGELVLFSDAARELVWLRSGHRQVLMSEPAPAERPLFDNFIVGAKYRHPRFGEGILITKRAPDKLGLLFEGDYKVLRCDAPLSLVSAEPPSHA